MGLEELRTLNNMAIKYEPPKPTRLEILKKQCKEIESRAKVSEDTWIILLSEIVSDLCDEIQRIEDLTNQGRRIG